MALLDATDLAQARVHRSRRLDAVQRDGGHGRLVSVAVRGRRAVLPLATTGPVAALFDAADGSVVESFAAPLPALQVLGFALPRLAPRQGGEAPSDVALAVLGAVRRAARSSDARLLCVAATASARFSGQDRSGGPAGPLLRQFADWGASGVQYDPETGCAALLYADRLSARDTRLDRARAGLARHGIHDTRLFRALGSPGR